MTFLLPGLFAVWLDDLFWPEFSNDPCFLPPSKSVFLLLFTVVVLQQFPQFLSRYRTPPGQLYESYKVCLLYLMSFKGFQGMTLTLQLPLVMLWLGSRNWSRFEKGAQWCLSQEDLWTSSKEISGHKFRQTERESLSLPPPPTSSSSKTHDKSHIHPRIEWMASWPLPIKKLLSR